MTSRPGYIDEPGYRRFATDLRRDIEDHRWSEDEALPEMCDG